MEIKEEEIALIREVIITKEEEEEIIVIKEEGITIRLCSLYRIFLYQSKREVFPICSNYLIDI